MSDKKDDGFPTIEEAAAFAQRYSLTTVGLQHLDALTAKMGEIVKAGLAVSRPESKMVAPAAVFRVPVRHWRQ